MTDPWAGWTCRTCKKPIVDGQAVYTVATDDELKITQHYACYEKIRQDFTEANERLTLSLIKAKGLLRELKGKL